MMLVLIMRLPLLLHHSTGTAMMQAVQQYLLHAQRMCPSLPTGEATAAQHATSSLCNVPDHTFDALRAQLMPT